MLYEELKEETLINSVDGERFPIGKYKKKPVDEAIKELLNLLSEKDAKIAELESSVRKIIKDAATKQSESLEYANKLVVRIEELTEYSRSVCLERDQAVARSKDLALRLVDLQDKNKD